MLSVSVFILQSVKILCLAVHIHSQYKVVKNIYIYNMVYLYSYTCKAIDPSPARPFYLQMLCLVDMTARQDKNNLSDSITVDERLQKEKRNGKQDVCKRKAWTGRWTCRHCSIWRDGRFGPRGWQ